MFVDAPLTYTSSCPSLLSQFDEIVRRTLELLKEHTVKCSCPADFTDKHKCARCTVLPRAVDLVIRGVKSKREDEIAEAKRQEAELKKLEKMAKAQADEKKANDLGLKPNPMPKPKAKSKKTP